MDERAQQSGRLDLPSSPSAAPVRRPLDAFLILHEAIKFIDEHGRDRLTMRQLGSRLGVEAMALYRYVPGREQLLDGVVEVVMDELYRDTMLEDRTESWPEYLSQIAHGVRRIALAHPRVFPLVATRPPAAPWLRPPLRSLRWVEGFLEGLARHGFNSGPAVATYRAFSTFLLGHLLLETGTMGTITSGEDDIAFLESNDLANYPQVMQLSAELSKDAYEEEFRAALEDLIDRVALLRG
ncbi:MAG: TetR/AcrR family transcriptional regulator [Actinomycetes bacterium]